MGRKRKQTVDYFPHMVSHKRTMFVIEGKWGNDGYAFWFKLLEILGSSEGHVFNCNLQENWEFLLAKTHISTNKAVDIMDTLASLDAIDPELWAKKVVWCQNFVDGLNPVYDNRKTKPPSKPNLISTGNLLLKMPYLLTPSSEKKVVMPFFPVDNGITTPKNGITTPLEYSKGKEVEQSIGNPLPETPLPIRKLPPQKTKQISQQLTAAANMLRNEDTAEYKKLLELHPELAVEETPWDVHPTGEK